MDTPAAHGASLARDEQGVPQGSGYRRASKAPNARIAAFSSVASRWVLAHPHISSVIPGFRNARQATCNVSAGSAEPMSPTDVAFVRALFAE